GTQGTITVPLGLAGCPARKQSKPAPLTRSRTVSPDRSAAAGNGVPHPRPRSAPSGTAAMSSSEYPRRAAESLVLPTLPQQLETGALFWRQQFPDTWPLSRAIAP